MITYEPFWHMLKASNVATDTVTYELHISTLTIDRLRKNRPLNTTTLNDLCRIFNCNISDLICYKPSDQDQSL